MILSSSVWEALNGSGAAVAGGCALYVIIQDRRWRKGDVWKGILERIDKAERWQDSEKGKALLADMHSADMRISACEGLLDNTATKNDVTKLEGMIQRVDATSKDTKAGVDRIEGMLMERALGPK